MIKNYSIPLLAILLMVNFTIVNAQTAVGSGFQFNQNYFYNKDYNIDNVSKSLISTGISISYRYEFKKPYLINIDLGDYKIKIKNSFLYDFKDKKASSYIVLQSKSHVHFINCALGRKLYSSKRFSFYAQLNCALIFSGLAYEFKFTAASRDSVYKITSIIKNNRIYSTILGLGANVKYILSKHLYLTGGINYFMNDPHKTVEFKSVVQNTKTLEERHLNNYSTSWKSRVTLSLFYTIGKR